MITAVQLVHRTLGAPAAIKGRGKNAVVLSIAHLPQGHPCHLCGGGANEGAPLQIAKLELTSFTAWSLARASHSPYVCAACLWALKTIDTRTKAVLVATDTACFLSLSKLEDRRRIRDAILDPPPGAFVLSMKHLTRDIKGHKHSLLWAPINYAARPGFWVQFGEQAVYVIPEQMRGALVAILALKEANASSKAIRLGQFTPGTVHRLGKDEFTRCENVVRQIRRRHGGNALFDLLFLMSNERSDIEAESEGQEGIG